MAVNLKSKLRNRAVNAIILTIPKVESFEEAQHLRSVIQKGIGHGFFTSDEISEIYGLLNDHFAVKGW